MSKIALEGNASGTGTFTIASPNSNSNYTLNLPTATGTINTSGAVNEVPAGSASAPSIYPTGDTNTGIFFPAADTIAFAEGGAEAMRIDSSGNLGVGVTSTAARLDVQGVATASGLRVRGGGNAGVNIATFADVNGAGQVTIDPVGNFLVAGTSVSNLGTSNKVIVSRADNGNEPYMQLAGLATTNQNRMIFYNGNGAVGSITTNGSATAYNISSDYRLKENIRPMIGALAKVAQLKPCTYTWKTDGSAGEGFIAHELSEVCPQAVSGEKDAVFEDGSIKPQGIDVSFLVSTLTAAIQELKTELDSVKAELAALKGA